MTKPTTRKPIRRIDRSSGGPGDAAHSAVSATALDTDELEGQLARMQIDQETVDRIRKLPKDIGWLLFSAGIMGIILPGVIGAPFLLLGSFMIWPKSKGKAERWLSGQSPRVFKGSIKQINRFLDDLERRYPNP